MKKTLFIAIPIALMLIFVFIMNSTYFIRPFIRSIPEKLNKIENYIIEGYWNQADTELDELKKDLKSNKFIWMQFSIEREEMNQILLNLSEMKGSIKIKDTSNAIVALYDMKNHWDNLGK